MHFLHIEQIYFVVSFFYFNAIDIRTMHEFNKIKATRLETNSNSNIEANSNKK